MNGLIMLCRGCGAKNRIPADKQHLTAKCGRCGVPLAGATVTGTVNELSEATFHEKVELAPLPVLVDFYSPTCGPCQMVAPIMENIAVLHAGRAVVCKLNTSVHRAISVRFQIRGVPTLLFFSGGKVVDQMVGVATQPEIQKRLDALL